MRTKLRLLLLLPLLAACSETPVQNDIVGEPVDQTIQVVEVKSAIGSVLPGAQIVVGQTIASTNDYGLAHVKVDPAGRTTLLVHAKGFQPKQYEVTRPARTADDALTLIRLDPLP